MGIEIIPKVSMLGHQSTLIRDNKGIAVKNELIKYTKREIKVRKFPFYKFYKPRFDKFPRLP